MLPNLLVWGTLTLQLSITLALQMNCTQVLTLMQLTLTSIPIETK